MMDLVSFDENWDDLVMYLKDHKSCTSLVDGGGGGGNVSVSFVRKDVEEIRKRNRDRFLLNYPGWTSECYSSPPKSNKKRKPMPRESSTCSVSTTGSSSSSSVDGEVRGMIPRPTKKATKRLNLNSSYFSWTDGNLHLEFLLSIFAVGMSAWSKQNLERQYRDIGLSHISSTDDFRKMVNTLISSREECERILSEEFGKAKDLAVEIVQPTSKLCKPVLHVYPFKPFLAQETNDYLEKLSVLASVFDLGVEISKAPILFEYMKNRGVHFANNHKIKSHLQKFVLNSRPSRDRFWNSFKIKMNHPK